MDTDKSMNGSVPSMEKIQSEPNGTSAAQANLELDTIKQDNSEDVEPQDENEDRKLSSVSFTVERQVFSQPRFDEGYNAGERPSKTIKQQCGMCKDKCECSAKCFKKKLFGFLPFIAIMKKYSLKEDLFYDCVAGLTVSVLQIPQGTVCREFFSFHFILFFRT